jgi:Rps23 Pro-64 3,4-dihydroxylase Tpa1-like proline 4-hydroxylase
MTSVASDRSGARLRQLTQLVLGRLESESERLREQFNDSISQVGVRYCTVENLLPVEIATQIHAVFPAAKQMRLLSSFRERKHTAKNLEEFDPLLADCAFAIQDAQVVERVERISGIQEQIPDSSLYAGGLSVMTRGHFLNPHIDNSHDASGKYYRTLNLLYYVSPGWSIEFGGNLELWDRTVRKSVTIPSGFNRLVIMETNPSSWHSVSGVKVDQPRCCVSNYYFSARSPIGRDYRNVTSFTARPEQTVRRAVARVDNALREAVRVMVPGGIGKKDVYRGRS